LAQRESSAAGSGSRTAAALIVVLIAAAAWFRVWHLGTMPGVSGDEGWWGVNAIAWLDGRPYEARTTSGNPTDLFLLAPLAAVHAFGPPSFWLLRIVPAAVNVLALPIGFFFVRRIFGTTTAAIYAVALAVAPTAIAHSRICQDPSQSIFWTGLVVYLSLLALARPASAVAWLAGALLLFPIALWTHPTNVFIAPFLIAPAIAVAARLLPASRRGRAIVFIAAAMAIAVAAGAAWPILLKLEASNDFAGRPWLALAAARLIDPRQWLEFGVNYARLFSGVTVYHYFSGARPWTIPYDLASVGAGVAVFAGLWRLRRSASLPLEYALLGAWACMLLLFFAFAGPAALRPHAERWGLCLIVPGSLVIARGIAGWIETAPALRRVTSTAAVALASVTLLSFYVNYFREFAATGGRSHLAYRTAPIEPKQQALDRIIATRDATSRTTVVAQEWWTYWPIAYLSSRDGRVSVNRTFDSSAAYVVEFTGTPELAAALDWVQARGLQARPTEIRDAGGGELLTVLEIGPAR